MIQNSYGLIKNCSDAEAWSIVGFFINLCDGLEDFSEHEEIQVLLNALVRRLGKLDHYRKVLKANISRLETNRKLTLSCFTESHHRPFDRRQKLAVNYDEDDTVYQCCGNWTTSTVDDIDLCRVVFRNDCSYLSKLLAQIFYLPETDKEIDKLGTKPKVPKEVKALMSDRSTLQFVVDQLKLSEDETDLLYCAYCTQAFKEMYSFCNDVYRVNSNRLDIYATCLGANIKEIRRLLRVDQKLRSFGFMFEDGDIASDAIDSIADRDLKVYFADIVKNESNIKSFSLDSFSVPEKKTKLAVKLLKNNGPCSILLYGAPGSGKSEFAKALIKESGLKMAVYKNEIEVESKDEGKAEAMAVRRLNCYLSLDRKDSILMVDEAETVLKTSAYGWFGGKISLPQKGTINRMLENNQNKIIFILNYTDELDESTLRRFTYSLKFCEMPKETMRSIAESKLDKLPVSARLKQDLVNLCDEYQLTGASVENMVRTVKTMDTSSGNEEEIIDDVNSVLKANSTLVFGKKSFRDKVRKSYDLSVLNTSIPAEKIVKMISTFVEKQSENSECGARLLFYGLSGTGKTELARYISQKVGKKILLKRASDILDKYVGESEKKIREAFEEASETDSILLFDEADSFFSDRNSASNSWERTQVNEFLTQMEEFNGILICTTNLRKIMDPAMQRRFHLLTEFGALKEEGISKLLKKFFPECKFADGQIQKLSRYDSVTPGDFGSLSERLMFVGDDEISADYIVGELCRSQEEKLVNGGGSIGFRD